MNPPQDLDALLSEVLASFIPEPAPAIHARVMRRIRLQRRKRWVWVPAMLAAGMSILLLTRQSPIKPMIQTPPQPMQVSVLSPPEATPMPVPAARHPHRRRPALTPPTLTPPTLTREEQSFLVVARQLPRQFPQLVTTPEPRPIEPITIADLQPPTTLVPEMQIQKDAQ